MIRAQGTLFTIVFAVAALWLSFNLRLALGGVGDVRPVFMTRDGIEVTLPGQQQMRTIALGAATFLPCSSGCSRRTAGRRG